ncbi:arginyltransferase [Rhodomicrobium lacus]|uniref:arginyltransferase n=1 Tax=Rhodomicrobium lacus TaxID=2498452 RepID=UPI0026E14631|nr:arginyltransferase [Rhodomicrobium lacus]WKW52092.1 arginyltransferase [Rhodomicrobium lacus]
MDQKRRFPEFYVTAPQPCPYLPGRMERKIFTHLSADRPVALVDNLLKGGFRRSQNIAYMPYCDHCAACVPVRIVVNEFKPHRTLAKIARINEDLSARRISGRATLEQFSLFREYIEVRHADGGMADMTLLDYSMMIQDSAVETYLTEYRLKPRDGENSGPLIAAVLCDRLSDGISLVYSFYDPNLSKRGLGNYIILEQVEFARARGLPYVYLGYWIAGSRKMGYKTRFTPQEHLTPLGWVRRTP